MIRGIIRRKYCWRMIFNSFNFIIIFPLLFMLYYIIPGSKQRVRNVFLLLVSYLLYMQWKPTWALILLAVTVVTYAAALMLERRAYSRGWLTVGVVLALLPLIFFKYFDIVGESVSLALSAVGLKCSLHGLNWAIPVGISFFTFQALGYLWDVYYRRQEAEQDFLAYALFVSFFPSILSGPINRASLFLPQLKQPRKSFDYEKTVAGLKMLLWGMFMKVVVADRVGLYVDTVMQNYENYNGLTDFMASVLYSVQIYTDFGGYSLMAIGVGKVLGFELRENFRRPYFAVSVTDFWHRWHISLSTWLKDYVYIPLGGSRCSTLRNYWNIFVTFLVSGIWHGANWTFIVWGMMHGVFQIIEKAVGQQRCSYGSFGRSIKMVITFLIVNFAWIFFRMPTLSDACHMTGRIFTSSWDSLYFDGLNTTAFILFGLIMLVAKDLTDEFMPTRFRILDSPYVVVRWSAYVFIMISILLAGVFGADQFIYANF